MYTPKTSTELTPKLVGNRRILTHITDTPVTRVFLDLDGVLYNWVRAVAPIIHTLRGCTFALGERQAEQYARPTHWDIAKYYHVSGSGLWAGIDEMQGFWDNIPLYPWAQTLVHALEKGFGKDNVSFLTDPAGRPEALRGKAVSVIRDFGVGREGMSQRFLPIAEKELVAKENFLLVDDRDENVKRWVAAGGQAILWPQTWNQSQEALDTLNTESQQNVVSQIIVQILATRKTK